MAEEQVREMPSGRAEFSGEPAVTIEGLTHRYGEREALAGITLRIARGEIFGLLGPNGGGKTTLFKILATLLVPTGGQVTVFGHDLASEAAHIRRHLGVVFQHPSLDPKLTVAENLHHHGHLYGMRGPELRRRAHSCWSGWSRGARPRPRGDAVRRFAAPRRIGQGADPRPEILLLDEPSTGLDPGARRDFTHHLGHLRTEEGVSVLLTTHILDEAERCDRLGILHRGRLVGLGTPGELKTKVGGDVVVIHSHDAELLRVRIRERFGCDVLLVDGNLRVEMPLGHEFAREVANAFGDAVEAVTFGRPTLEDVFIHLTGDRLWGENGT
jgi:ABC-2 type transport system ATP-binding protein